MYSGAPVLLLLLGLGMMLHAASSFKMVGLLLLAPSMQVQGLLHLISFFQPISFDSSSQHDVTSYYDEFSLLSYHNDLVPTTGS